MKRKNQLDDYIHDNIKKVRFNLPQRNNKRCATDSYYEYNGTCGASDDDDECNYDRKKRLKINNGFTFQRTFSETKYRMTKGAKAEKNKNNIPSYIN